MVQDKELHYRSAEEIRRFQEARLRETIAYVADRSAFYSAMFRREKIDPETICTLEDLKRLPLTSKEDLQLRGKEFVCVDRRAIIDYVTTSGTLGDPVTFALTEGDLKRLAYNEASSFSLAGCTDEDVMQLMTTIDRRFMAGLAYFLGARELGLGVVRVGNGIPELQWDTIRRVGSTVCMVVPSFLMKLIEYAEKNGFDPNESTLKRAICIGETLRTADGSLTKLAEKISERWPQLELHSTYASTEMQSSFTECSAHQGGHIPADLIIVELLDDAGRDVADGEPGEVTITTLGVEGMPLVRFRTGDICIRYNDPCPCGRNTPRLSGVIGRKGQMIKFKGTTLYPPALFDILDNIPEVENYLVEVFTNSLGTDQIQIKIGSQNHSESFIKQIKDIFRSKVRVAPDIRFEAVELIAKQQMPPMSRKVVKFFDLRNK
ncbi:MAG: AMP-binding protein [Rikenellaceae bacterium]|nr:AMP-binding protein [Rikenellaceae bacterium]